MISLFGKNEPEPTLLDKLKASVSKTKAVLSETVDTIFQGERKIDPALLKQLETALLSADLGVRTTKEILESVREKLDRNALSNGEQLKREIKAHIVKILTASAASVGASAGPLAGPAGASTNGQGTRVIFVVGVNGAGKTTSIGKLANRLRKDNFSVILCAADTFRAAAVEQLEIWAHRNGIEVIKQKSGADPAAVVYDAVAAAKARAHRCADRRYCRPTAHEIEPDGGARKNEAHRRESDSRRAARCAAGSRRHHRTNGLAQAREFTSSVRVTGIILTKLDGTAKGGIVVAIARELGLPIRFVGTGEQINDLVPFDAETYVNSLFD